MGVSQAGDVGFVVLETLSVNPLLIIKGNSDSDRVFGHFEMHLILLADHNTFLDFLIRFRSIQVLFLFFLLVSLCFEHPGEGRHGAADGTVFAIPVSRHFTDPFFAVGLELDALDRCVVQAASAYDEVGASFNRSEVGFNFLNFNIVVPERDGLASELLSVESHVHVVAHVVRLESV